MNRFHSKFHRKNHHTNPDPNNPDAGHDPIASASAPFQGDFHLNGSLNCTGGTTLTGISLLSSFNAVGFANLTVGASALVNTNKITLSSIVFLTPQSLNESTAVGTPFIFRRVNATSFTISSTNINDRSVIGWFIVQPK